MEAASRSRGWRRYVAGLAFVAAVALLASRACRSEAASATIQLRVGEAGAELRSLRAELYRGDDPEQVAFSEWWFEDEKGSGEVVGPWRLRADPGLYRMEVRGRTAAGRVEATRAIDLVDGASITVDLARDLEPAAAGGAGAAAGEGQGQGEGDGDGAGAR